MRLQISKGPNLREGKPSFPFEGKGSRKRTPSSEHSSKGTRRRLRFWAVGTWADGRTDRAQGKAAR